MRCNATTIMNNNVMKVWSLLKLLNSSMELLSVMKLRRINAKAFTMRIKSKK